MMADQGIEQITRTLKPIEILPLPENPIVSVLIANYNYGHFIDQAIESVLDQSYVNFELVICDDGSTDDSCAIVERYARHDPRIFLLRQPNFGQAAALNAAYRQSRGEVICLLDSDDRYLPGKLEIVVRDFRAHPNSGFLIHRIFQVDKDGHRVGILPPLWDPPSGWHGEFVLRTGDPPPGLVPTSGLCMRRDVAHLICPLPERLRIGADAAVCCLACLTTRLIGERMALAEYRYHGKNRFAPSQVNEDLLLKLLAFYRASWSAQRDYLGRVHPSLADVFPPLEERLGFQLANYVRARLSGGSGAFNAYRSVVKNVRFSSSPFPIKLFWAASILLPLPVFKRAVDWIWVQRGWRPLKRLISAALRFLYGRWNRMPELL